MKYFSSRHTNNKVNNSIIIIGSGRSGTSILGNIIHSFKNVEYAYEPPTLEILFPMIDEMPKDIWKQIYEIFLYEEFLHKAIAGRNINLNRNDISCIYNVKSKEEIETRLSKSFTRFEIEGLIDNKVIAYKYVGSFNILKLIDYYPGTRIIEVYRDPNSTINSIVN